MNTKKLKNSLISLIEKLETDEVDIDNCNLNINGMKICLTSNLTLKIVDESLYITSSKYHLITLAINLLDIHYLNAYVTIFDAEHKMILQELLNYKNN